MFPFSSFNGYIVFLSNLISSSAFFHLAYDWQYPARAVWSTIVSNPRRFNSGATRFHSCFASSMSQSGQAGIVGSGCGSYFGRGRFDGFPSKILSFRRFFGWSGIQVYPPTPFVYAYCRMAIFIVLWSRTRPAPALRRWSSQS